MLLKSRFKRKIWLYVDYYSYICMYSWLFFLSSFWASFISLTGESTLHKFFNYFVKAPFCGFFCCIFLPVGIFGIIAWIVVCLIGNPAPYSYWEVNDSLPKQQKTFTIISANLCLMPDVFAKFNNNSFTYCRALKIARRIISQCKCAVNYCNDRYDADNSSIISRFPQADFICFQEVWERVSALLLISILKSWFNYFIYDVGEYKWSANKFCLGSGLMFASRFPIADAKFKSFRVKTFQGIFVSLGLLQVKVVLSVGVKGSEVGYIATTHLQCYQGKKLCLIAELDEALDWLREFRRSTLKRNETIAFDIFCGDFNFDNLSPGDQRCARHQLFDEYVDPCRMKAGEDCAWAIGTEMRQRMLWDDSVSSPEKFKRSLQDPILRRYFLLDADVEVQTIGLAFLKVPFDKNGTIQFSPVGGRRRVDYILYNGEYPQCINKYNFITALNQLTDHIPVSMTFEIK